MAEKILNSRIVHKHDTEENWLKATNFIPKQGELIVYDKDKNYNYERIKIGDGETLVSQLPFVDAGTFDLANTAKIKAESAHDLASKIVYVGPTEPTDPNVKVWINTSEEGTGVIPVLPRVATITLSTNSWKGSSAPYSQTVNIATVTSSTKIELNPTVTQIVSLQNDDIALMAENNNGVVTVYSFGGKPSTNMTMQATLTEVSYV